MIMNLAAHLAEAAYLSPNDIIRVIDDLGMLYFDWVENRNTDCQGFVCASKTDAFISIRGTEFDNPADWETNLDCKLEQSKFGAVHRGFRNDAMSVFYQVASHLVKHRVAGRRIHTTGHSMGAAVSKQIALQFLATSTDIASAWGFGEPRHVSRECARNLDARFSGIFHRVVNNNDLVTRIPLRLMGFGHFGNLHYFSEDGEYTQDPSAWTRFLDRVHGRFADIGEAGTDGLKDHNASVYTRITDAVNS